MEFNELMTIASADVKANDGGFVGEIAAVHVDEGTDHVRFVEVAKEGESAHFIVPTAGASVTGDSLVVSYTADDIEQGPLIDEDQVLSVGEVASVVWHYGGQVEFEGQPITDRSTMPIDLVEAKKKRFKRKPLPPVVRSKGPSPEAIR